MLVKSGQTGLPVPLIRFIAVSELFEIVMGSSTTRGSIKTLRKLS
jgi:hypothetical protein